MITHLDAVSLTVIGVGVLIAIAFYIRTTLRKDGARKRDYDVIMKQKDKQQNVGDKGNIVEPPHSYDGTHDY